MRFLLLFLVFSWTAVAEEKVRDLTASDISFLRIHTSNHSTVSVKRTALVRVTSLDVDCTKGVFIILDNDPETYSTLLAAIASERDVRFGFDTSIKTPWNDPNYCALTSLDIKN